MVELLTIDNVNEWKPFGLDRYLVLKVAFSPIEKQTDMSVVGCMKYKHLNPWICQGNRIHTSMPTSIEREVSELFSFVFYLQILKEIWKYK